MSPTKAVVEATSSGYWLADWAESRNIELVLAHAKMLKAIAYAKVKTDSVDAHTNELVYLNAIITEENRKRDTLL